MSSSDIKSLGGFVWSITEPLRGDFKQFEYSKALQTFAALQQNDVDTEVRELWEVVNLAVSPSSQAVVRG